MSTNSYLQLGSIEALVIRKPIKNLHLSVLPPMGSVRITAPEYLREETIRTLIVTKLPWIKKQQAKFIGQERQTKREYVSGESHYLFGKRYRLEVIYKDAVPHVYLKGKNKIILQLRPKSSLAKRHEIVTEWYRGQLHSVAEELMTTWERKIGVNVSKWGIKRMKTRWGTCNQSRATILINLELVKKPISCVEYVVVHELIHLIEKRHNKKFVALMSKYLPKWQSMKEELNRFVLSHEEWEY